MDRKFVKNVVISGVLLGLSISFVSSTVKVLDRSKRLIQVKEELAALKRQKADLEREAEYRKSAEFIEEEARNKLNMVKPGETVYIKPKIMGDDLLGTASSRPTPSEEGKKEPARQGLIDKIKEILVLFRS